jgi:prolyl oligopeptidase
MSIRTLALACAMTLASPAPAAPNADSSAAETPADPHRWLEDVAGAEPLAWVRGQNADSTHELARSRAFARLEARLLAMLDSEDKIPYVERNGSYYYNFWRDARHERGIWRRTTLAEYRKDEPRWETVLDLDALGKAEGENWVWHGADCLPPDYRRCLVSLSRGGADADVVREFDLESKAFIDGGFSLPEAKTSVAWHDRDAIYVGTDFGPGSMTSSGYPRVVKLWRRGTPLGAAATVYEGRPDDVGVAGHRDLARGYERDFVLRYLTFYTNELYLLRDGELIKVDKPDDADAGVHRDWLYLTLRSDWTLGGRTWRRGSLLAARFDDWIAGKRELTALFEPSERISLAGYVPTRNHLILNTLDNVLSRLYVLTPAGDGWRREPLPGVPEFGDVNADAIDADESDEYFLQITDFTTPSSLHYGAIGAGKPEQLKQLPPYFDAAHLVVSQHAATSKDGTRVPYFQVAPKGLVHDGRHPTLLTGYGGFEVAQTPSYSAGRGIGWLENGGVFVLANIRGGGEFGPAWHQAALKASRPRAYEDFAAVAQDLIARRVTSAEHLGIMGGSNGGLLMGNMLTMYPQLFGAIVCQVPLLDMRRYHTLLAGASWMAEFGNPDLPEEWAFIKTFSPYHNVAADAAYPRVLFTTSTRDDRVHPGHARKMVAKMKAQGHDVLYYENIEGGHGGAANNKQAAFMAALAYTFLWHELH